MNTDLREALGLVHWAISTGSLDWTSGQNTIIIYALIAGFDPDPDDDDDDPVDWLASTAAKYGWSDAFVARVRRLHAVIAAVERGEPDPTLVQLRDELRHHLGNMSDHQPWDNRTMFERTLAGLEQATAPTAPFEIGDGRHA